MSESATKPTGVREQRRERTRRELTRQARILTIERGLSGFTVEELCDLVGVSRRTFFNYFHAKDDAVIGHTADSIDEEALADFVNARPGGDAGVSPTLMDDLAALAIASLPFGDEVAEGEPNPEMLVEREPQLLPKFMREGAVLERMLIEAVAAREGLDPGDARAEMAVHLGSALVRRAATVYLSPGNTTDFAAILLDSLDAARALFIPATEGTA